MEYLVEVEFIDPGVMLPMPQLAEMIEQLILPTFDALDALRKEKKVLGGGLIAGDRAGAFIIEAKDNEEADRLVHELPFWGVVKSTVTPLVPFSARKDMDAHLIKQVKSMKK